VRSLVLALSAFVLVTFASIRPAHATPMSITDIVNPTPDIYFRQNGDDCRTALTAECDEYDYLHDLTDQGYTPGTDTLLGASLTIYFYDESDPGGQQEKVDISLDNTVVSGVFHDASTNFNYSFGSATVFTSLANDGQLLVTLDAQSGDFFFDQSHLIIRYDELNGTGGDPEPIVSTPEPASLLLLGGGLGMIAQRVRRKKRAAQKP